MATTPSHRQKVWLRAAEESSEMATGLFLLIAQPNERERQHDCREHAVGFRRNGRRGFKCGIDGNVIKWKDPE